MASVADTPLALPHRWTLRDGTPCTLRRIAPGDFAIERAFVDGLSADTSFNRLFSTRHPDASEIERWTNVDAAREEALVVTSARGGAEFMLAVARSSRAGSGSRRGGWRAMRR